MTEELQSQILTGIQALTEALEAQKKAAVEHGTAEHAYRKATAMKYLDIMAGTGDGKKPTEAHIKAMIDLACEREMLRVRLAEADHESSNELVRSLRQQLSCYQSVLAASKAEADALRYGQIS